MKGTDAMISILQEEKEYCLRRIVQRIQDSFESEELDNLSWIQIFANITATLTKHNPTSFKLLNQVLSSRILELSYHDRSFNQKL